MPEDPTPPDDPLDATAAALDTATTPVSSSDYAPGHARADTPSPSAPPQRAKRKPGPKIGSDAARRGGMATRERHGKEFFKRIGQKGGKSLTDKHGIDYLRGLGGRGGKTTSEKYGNEHYRDIGREGGKKSRRKRKTFTSGGSEPGSPTE